MKFSKNTFKLILQKPELLSKLMYSNAKQITYKLFSEWMNELWCFCDLWWSRIRGGMMVSGWYNVVQLEYVRRTFAQCEGEIWRFAHVSCRNTTLLRYKFLYSVLQSCHELFALVRDTLFTHACLDATWLQSRHSPPSPYQNW